jgi:hypothetical protein
MDAGDRIGTLTTRTIRFRGKHLFVNVACPAGELRVEVLDDRGQAIAPFSADNCIPVRTDKTLKEVRWKKANDLAAITDRPLRFRFSLRSGRLYAFWVSAKKSGASHGYVAAGGPSFTGSTDTVGSAAKQE